MKKKIDLTKNKIKINKDNYYHKISKKQLNILNGVNIIHEIPSAFEFLKNFDEDPNDDTIYNAMVEFAREHVTQALLMVVENVRIIHTDVDEIVDKRSIINSYPLSKIK